MATTRVTLDTTAESLIQIFNDNEEELLTSHMPSNIWPDVTDENKFGGDSVPRIPVSLYAFGGTNAFDADYKGLAEHAIRSQFDLEAGKRTIADDALGVLIERTTQEQLKVKNLLDHYLNPRAGTTSTVEDDIIRGKQYPTPRVVQSGEFKGATGPFSRYSGARSYDGDWFRYQGSGYTQSPTKAEIVTAAMHGLIVGQIDPSVYIYASNRWWRGAGLRPQTLEGETQQLVHELFGPGSDFESFLGMLPGIQHPESTFGNIKRISQLYKPGFPRPAEPFITQKLLD